MKGPFYLAGAVEKSDTPDEWRDHVMYEYGYIDWTNPRDFSHLEGAELVEKCKNETLRSKGLLIWYEKDTPTWGTPQEQFMAYSNGIPCVVWTTDEEKNLPEFLKHHSHFRSPVLRECVQWLLKNRR